mgnify:CR=1 FL=1
MSSSGSERPGAATPKRPGPDDLHAAEQWLSRNGLPYFVDDTRDHVLRGLQGSRLLPVAVLALVLAVVAGVAATQWTGLTSVGISTGLQVAVAVAVVYGLVRLRAVAIAGWALRHTFASLSMLVPLATRALPLLLIFITFLFINTEVWMVAESLDGGVMWLTVLLFGAVITAFLLSRLPEEVGGLDDGLDGSRVSSSCAGTPMAAWVGLDERSGIDEPLTRLERSNLVLVLLISQVVQVLLLSLSVFGFFVVFGAVIMDSEVITAWIGHAPTQILGTVITRELLQVAVFLASFSGLYFTVYAVTDETYRSQFFTAITAELERAVSAREVYRAMRRSRHAS